MIRLPVLRFAGVAFLVLLARTELEAQAAPLPTVFRANSQMVLVPVTVTSRNGKTLQGLHPENFAVLEDRVPQRIVSFTAGDAPCSVGLVLDISGSMRNTLGLAKGVLPSFFQAANADDQFLLLTVSTQPAAVSDFTSDVAGLEESIGRTNPKGMTALIDTIYLGLNQMRKAAHPRRALLVLSDGRDNFSRYSKSELMRVALEADVQIYTIVMGDRAGGASSGVPYRPGLAAKPIDQARDRQGALLLEELSEKTGGLHFRARSDAQAQEAVSEVARALRDQYMIGYQPHNPGQTGTYHQVRVKSNVSKANVYARSGYYAP
jgi:Ca-activated chloride channel family protein